MDFSLNDQQRALQETVRRFAQSELPDVARQIEEEHEPPGPDILKRFAELGLLGRLEEVRIRLLEVIGGRLQEDAQVQTIFTPGETPMAYLRRAAWEGAGRRYGPDIPLKVRQLLEHELGYP